MWIPIFIGHVPTKVGDDEVPKRMNRHPDEGRDLDESGFRFSSESSRRDRAGLQHGCLAKHPAPRHGRCPVRRAGFRNEALDRAEALVFYYHYFSIFIYVRPHNSYKINSSCNFSAACICSIPCVAVTSSGLRTSYKRFYNIA